MSAPIVRFDTLAVDDAHRIIELFRPYLTEARQNRIATVLAGRTRDVVVVLEDIYGDHNGAAVLRTAEGLGILEVHAVLGKTTFRLSRKISMGSHKWLDFRRHRDVRAAYDALRARGYAIWAADVHRDPRPVCEVPVDRPVALVFGNEHEGLTTEAVQEADGVFLVPMRGFVESYNISVASALSMYDVMQRREAIGFSPLAEEERVRLMATWYTASVRAAPQLLARADLPRPVMSDARTTYYERGPGGGHMFSLGPDEDLAETPDPE